MDLPASLHFHGPFFFVDQGRGIATCEFAHSEGIYLWVLTDGTSRYVHYVGQTTGFLSRHKEHLTHILSLNYGLFHSDAVTANDPAPLFGGMWRMRRTAPNDDPLTSTIGKWQELQHRVLPYLKSIEVFFAPTSLTLGARCHIEGCIAHSIRKKHPYEARFYPADNRTGRGAVQGVNILVTSDHPIMGIEPLLEL